MTTLSTASLNWFASQWENSYKSAVISGIVGDLAHKKRGGYHISREDQPRTNYSVIRADDRPGNGPNNRASAIDMTMSTADMKTCHVRLRNSWKNRAKDPRWRYINAWNGWDGTGEAGRYDVVTGNVSTATPDHKWHIHLEIRRKYVNDMEAMRAILSLLKGEPLVKEPAAPVVSPEKPVVIPPVVKEEKMELTDKLYTGETASSWTARYGNADPTVRNALAFAAFDATDAEKQAVAANVKLDALAQAVAGIAAKVDLDPAEIEALRDALSVPTAEQNADAVVDALSGKPVEELAEVLRNVLGNEKVAALKNVL